MILAFYRFAVHSLLRALFQALFLAAVFSASVACAQSVYDKDGLKFDYPAGWVLTDKSNSSTQSMTLSKPGSDLLISIVSPRDVIEDYAEYQKLQNEVNNRYVIAIKQGLNTGQDPTKEEPNCLDFNGRNISGVRFTGTYRKNNATGDVFPFVLGDRFINLIYMRTDQAEAVGSPAWLALVRSLRLQNSQKEAVKVEFEADRVSPGELGGRSTYLALPGFNFGVVRGLYRGKVEASIRVVVDETGKVIETDYYKGLDMLQLSIVQAARFSKFRPSLACGKPVKITGVITYRWEMGDVSMKPVFQ